ncbi:TauD/TfdA dioxygenase family protein [Candidatus Protofrankia californiensis]|uniref:TauD/TfdA dioxygenase family protein n=1 Tax=Candidatus Protofrankia californiensis TaxID=1839754 RepID=UPI0010418DF3|nr:TauD/TfdA family dioxygenase [Candidatus Protofrankia californiensis]
MTAVDARDHAPSSTDAGLEVRPLTGLIGAEIFGVDLGEELADEVVADIRAALLRWKVVFFRDQHIGHAEQIAFARRFGRVTPSHVHNPYSVDGFPEILTIDSGKIERRGGPRQFAYDARWHSDITALVNPPWGSVLRAHVVPQYGGDTVWTNLVAAYEGLPPALRDLADILWVKHSTTNTAQYLGAKDPHTKLMADNPLVTIHPVVRVHPETGEKALWVSPAFTVHDREIIGFDRKQDSERILDLFYEHIGRIEYTTRFRWAPGSVAFWDNRAAHHQGLARDLDHVDYERVLYRVTLEGDVPVGPDGRRSESVLGGAFLAEEPNS